MRPEACDHAVRRDCLASPSSANIDGDALAELVLVQGKHWPAWLVNRLMNALVGNRKRLRATDGRQGVVRIVPGSAALLWATQKTVRSPSAQLTGFGRKKVDARPATCV